MVDYQAPSRGWVKLMLNPGHELWLWWQGEWGRNRKMPIPDWEKIDVFTGPGFKAANLKDPAVHRNRLSVLLSQGWELVSEMSCRDYRCLMFCISVKICKLEMSTWKPWVYQFTFTMFYFRLIKFNHNKNHWFQNKTT